MRQLIDKHFKKSTYSEMSGDKHGDCVEIMRTDNKIFVRDSKNKDLNTLEFTSSEWKAFIQGVKNKEFDLLS